MSVTGAEACVWASISTERVTGNHDERVLRRRQTQKFDPSPYFQKRVKDRPLPLGLSELCEALRTPTPPWTPSAPRQMMCAAPDSRRRHRHCGLAAEPGPAKY